MITIEELKKFTDVEQAIEYAETFFPVVIENPIKPTLKKNPTVSEATEFVELLKIYEIDLVKYNDDVIIESKLYDDVQNIIVSYIKEVSGLNDIDEKYHQEILHGCDFYYSIKYGNESYYDIYKALIEKIKDFKTNDIVTEQQFIDAQFLIKKYLKQKLHKKKFLGRSKITSIPESDFAVHVTHCCFEHGCKYGDPECPVELGIVDQEYECEQCRDDRNENCFYFTI